MSHVRPAALALFGLLLLAFASTRLIALDRFPMFLDEGIHANWIETMQATGPFAFADEGRQFSLWWFALFGPEGSRTVFVMRAATVLAGLVGFAGWLAAGRTLMGKSGALIGGTLVGLFLLFSPFHLFFDRLALADPVSTAAIGVAAAFAARLARRVRLVDAAGCGLALFLAVGAKNTALPYLFLPLAAAFAFGVVNHPGRPRIMRWLIVALGTAGMLLGAYVLVLRWRGYNFFSLIASGAGGGSLLDNLARNLPSLISTIAYYAGPVALIGLLLAVAAAWKPSRSALAVQMVLLALVLVPTAAILLSAKQFSRYYALPLALLLLYIGVALALAICRIEQPLLRRMLTGAAFVGVALWAAWQFVPMASALYSAPERAPLAAVDYREYAASDASGFGVAEVYAAAIQANITQVIGLFSNCEALRRMGWGQIAVTCPRLLPSGENVSELAAMAEGAPAGTWIVREPLSYVPKITYTRLITVPRPGEGMMLTVYAR